jgi:tetratricopeptide (TPR) repeat protein
MSASSSLTHAGAALPGLASVEVLLTPADFSTLARRDLGETTCVVFDVLRATTSMITALANGAETIMPVAGIAEALALYQKSVVHDPENYKAWLQVGITLLKLQRYGDALEVFRKLRSMNEYDGEVWLGLGISLYSLGQTMEAGDALKNAMRFKPNQPALYYYLALAEPDNDAALRLLLRGYRIDSSNLDIIIELVNRLVRSGMLDVLNQDYIRTARAKGLTERKVLIKHAFKNAAIPVVTITGMQLGGSIGRGGGN